MPLNITGMPVNMLSKLDTNYRYSVQGKSLRQPLSFMDFGFYFIFVIRYSYMSVADPGLRWGDQGAKCLVIALCLGPGAKGLVWYIFSYVKGAKLGPGGHGLIAPWICYGMFTLNGRVTNYQQ